MTALNKSGRKPSPNGQAKKQSVTVKAKIKRVDTDMEFAVNERPKKVVAQPETPIKKKKKKVVADVENRVVKTLKKQIEDAAEGRALVPVDGSDDMPVLAVRKISKLRNTNKMRSILGDEAENIHQLVEVGDTDNATSLIYKRILQVLVDLLPYAEHNVRVTKGQRGVYQVNSLIQSVRELMVDLQSAQDRGAMGEMLVEKIVRPIFLDIGMSLVRELAEVKNAAESLMTPENFNRFKPEMTSAKERIGAAINNGYESARDQTRQFLQR
jgi:hypothetical protein